MGGEGSLMNCSEFIELAPLYFSGELDARHASDLSQHLKECRSCAQVFDEQSRLDARLREAVLADQPDTSTVDARVRAQIFAPAAAQSAVQQTAHFHWRLATAAGVLLLLAAGIGYRVLIDSHVPRVFADAADDHQDEVVTQQPRRWLSDRAAIEALAAKQNVPVQDVTALEAKGYRLERGKICSLDDRIYLHLVYSAGGKEFSVFLRDGDGVNLSGAPSANSAGQEIYKSDRGDAHVAGVQADGITAFIVTNESGDIATQLAEMAARSF